MPLEPPAAPRSPLRKRPCRSASDAAKIAAFFCACELRLLGCHSDTSLQTCCAVADPLPVAWGRGPTPPTACEAARFASGSARGALTRVCSVAHGCGRRGRPRLLCRLPPRACLPVERACRLLHALPLPSPCPAAPPRLFTPSPAPPDALRGATPHALTPSHSRFRPRSQPPLHTGLRRDHTHTRTHAHRRTSTRTSTYIQTSSAAPRRRSLQWAAFFAALC